MRPYLNFHAHRGFTLIEILVSVVILAIGLLGLASLQTLSLKDNQDAYLYSQASALAYDMGDRIKANSKGWLTLPVTAAKGNECNSATNTCSVTQMAGYDYYIWQQNVTDKLAGGTGTVAACSGKTTACISLNWTGGHQGSQQFQLEVQQ